MARKPRKTPFTNFRASFGIRSQIWTEMTDAHERERYYSEMLEETHEQKYRRKCIHERDRLRICYLALIGMQALGKLEGSFLENLLREARELWRGPSEPLGNDIYTLPLTDYKDREEEEPTTWELKGG